MANSITKKALKEMPVIPYEKIRDHLKTGDIFFSSGSYAFSGVIQKLTKSTWSHVAVVYKDEELGRVLVLEAEPYIGIRLIPLSKYLSDYKGTKRPYKGQVAIAQLNIDELTRPYDNFEIVRIMIRILFHISRREKNRNYICSELVRDIFAKANVVMHYKDTYISPDAIYSDERVTLKYRIL
jgi:Permuted papain-like amidase enzyme, YaeF/YiiX, C92 family